MRFLSLIFVLCTTFFICAFTIQNKKMPSMAIETLEGETTDITEVLNKEGYTIVVFWQTWALTSKVELDAINEEYSDWKDETGVKVIAISLDNARARSKIAPLVSSKGWEFEFYNDVNRLSKETFGVQYAPHTIIINKDQEIVWDKADHIVGDEKKYIEFIREELSKK